MSRLRHGQWNVARMGNEHNAIRGPNLALLGNLPSAWLEKNRHLAKWHNSGVQAFFLPDSHIFPLTQKRRSSFPHIANAIRHLHLNNSQPEPFRRAHASPHRTYPPAKSRKYHDGRHPRPQGCAMDRHRRRPALRTSGTRRIERTDTSRIAKTFSEQSRSSLANRPSTATDGPPSPPRCPAAPASSARNVGAIRLTPTFAKTSGPKPRIARYDPSPPLLTNQQIDTRPPDTNSIHAAAPISQPHVT